MKHLLIFFSIFILGCEEVKAPKVTAEKDNAIQDVSMVALLANPDAFNGKNIHVVGAINLEFENRMLCLHSEDIAKGLEKNCIWVRFDNDALLKSEEDLLLFKNYYVIVEGTFDSSSKDSRCSGALTRISRIDPKYPF